MVRGIHRHFGILGPAPVGLGSRSSIAIGGKLTPAHEATLAPVLSFDPLRRLPDPSLKQETVRQPPEPLDHWPLARQGAVELRDDVPANNVPQQPSATLDAAAHAEGESKVRGVAHLLCGEDPAQAPNSGHVLP